MNLLSQPGAEEFIWKPRQADDSVIQLFIELPMDLNHLVDGNIADLI